MIPDNVLDSCTPCETTYVSHQGTGVHGVQASDPECEPDLVNYVSVRVTCSHIDMKAMLDKVFHAMEYICYPHRGQKTKKEHCHVLVPGCSSHLIQKIKKRLTRNGYTGNESYSIKGMHNGLHSGIQYASKEDTKPIVVGDFDKIIEESPKWHQQSIHSHYSIDAKPDKLLRDWQLTYTNLVPQAVHYAKVNKMGDSSLREVLKDMISKTKWRPSKYVISGGVPDFYRQDFAFRMGQRKDVDMSWYDVKF